MMVNVDSLGWKYMVPVVEISNQRSGDVTSRVPLFAFFFGLTKSNQKDATRFSINQLLELNITQNSPKNLFKFRSTKRNDCVWLDPKLFSQVDVDPTPVDPTPMARSPTSPQRRPEMEPGVEYGRCLFRWIRGSLKYPFGGIEQCKYMVFLREFL